MSSGNAKIGHPAPNFKATAVMPDGQFKDISLSDYKGNVSCYRVNTPKKQGGLGPMNIPLVSDPKHSIAQDYGVLKADEGISFRGLFIIDDKGILRQITVNDLPVGRSVDETLRLVQAFQFTDKHGEVCPAGWKPGSDTIKPDVQKSKEYFSKQK
ncbi:peroxiredoxin-1 [Microtus ochrogaster]|uniref:Peroxiredoxin-1 n=1 Tax=Microtus ochrogaster TaxID=79684 RepID=A0ABM0LRW2_MICOH|nr:peroxiredoxin-1 [Microtus ochrogaster]